MVFISNQYNLLYLVNPKCASVSIREFFKKNIKDNEMLQNKIGNEEYKNNHHHKIKEAKQMCINIGKNYDDYFSFTIIRNPWEKVISLYFYDKPDSNNRAFYEKDYDVTMAFHHSFNEWLNWAIINNKFNLFKIENFAFENGFQKVKKIYKMEDFSIAQLFHDLYLYNSENHISSSTIPIDFNINQALPYINTTSHEHYSAYYNEDSIEKVREVFAKDIEMGGYTF